MHTTLGTQTLKPQPSTWILALNLRCEICLKPETFDRCRIEFHPKTVWNKLVLGISAVSISGEVMAAFGDAQVISPIVEMFPRKTMFRQTVKVR